MLLVRKGFRHRTSQPGPRWWAGRAGAGIVPLVTWSTGRFGYSVRINSQWRTCFEWPAGQDGPENVEIFDYPRKKTAMPRTPIYPGEILSDELEELGLSAAEMARLIDVTANRIGQIIAGKRNITPDTDLRLGRYFGTAPDLWMYLQKTYELDLARIEIGPALATLPQRQAGQPRPV